MVSKDIVLNHRENKLLINYLLTKSFEKDLEYLPAYGISNNTKLKIRTHPELLESLWIDYSKDVPVECQWILFGTPILMNPNNGVVFALVEGTYPLLLRLSKNDKEVLKNKGAAVKLSSLDGVYADAETLGKDWVYCFSFINDLKEYFLKAYNYSCTI